jgi:uncharacterized protein YrrD
MTMYMKTSDVIGLPVVTIDGGEDVAEIRDVVYSSEAGTLLGFTLNKRGFLRGRMRESLPAESVSAIGSAAVMIETDECLVSKTEAPAEVATPAANRNVLGDPVITDTGVRLGTVTDLVLKDGGRGEIIGYELQREGAKEAWFVPRPQQIAVSGDALLVPASLQEYVSHDLTGFALSVERYSSAAAS